MGRYPILGTTLSTSALDAATIQHHALGVLDSLVFLLLWSLLPVTELSAYRGYRNSKLRSHTALLLYPTNTADA